MESGIWDRPPTALPDANTWPTWGALRERVLTATTEINILGSATVRDAFVAEVAKLSPPELSKLVSMGHNWCTAVHVPWTPVLGPHRSVADGISSHRQAPKRLWGSHISVASLVLNTHALLAPMVAGLPSASRLTCTGGSHLWLRQPKKNPPPPSACMTMLSFAPCSCHAGQRDIVASGSKLNACCLIKYSGCLDAAGLSPGWVHSTSWGS